jgi:hypothetical protein
MDKRFTQINSREGSDRETHEYVADLEVVSKWIGARGSVVG